MPLRAARGRGCGFGQFPYLECGRPRVGRAGPLFTGLPLWWQSNWMVAPGGLDEAQRELLFWVRHGCPAVSMCSAVQWVGRMCRASCGLRVEESPNRRRGLCLVPARSGLDDPVTHDSDRFGDTHFLNSIVALARAPCSCPLPTTIPMPPPPSANSANGAARPKKRWRPLCSPCSSPLTPPTADGPASSSSVS